MKNLIMIGLIAIVPFRVICQSSSEDSNHAPESSRHSLGIAIGHAHTFEGRDENGKRKTLALPCWSLDYNYRFHPRWAVGLHTDFILERFAVEDTGERVIQERSYPLAPAVVGMYSLSEHWTLELGTGIEFAKEGNVFLIRGGAEYSVELPMEWEVFGSLCYDIKWDTYRTLAISLGIAKRL